MNVASSPPNEILLFLNSDATMIVAPQPGIIPNKDPTIGCVHLGPILLVALLSLFLVAKLTNANPIIDKET